MARIVTQTVISVDVCIRARPGLSEAVDPRLKTDFGIMFI